MSREMTNVVSGIAPQITSTAYAPASDPETASQKNATDTAHMTRYAATSTSFPSLRRLLTVFVLSSR